MNLLESGPAHDDAKLVRTLRGCIAPLHNAEDGLDQSSDLDSLIDLVGDASLVLLGEASHGTHDFYRERDRITRRLIRDKGFCAVAVEADWPDAYQLNRYVQGALDDPTEAFAAFRRFPSWMWRNTDVFSFIRWLRDHNRSQPSHIPAVGFYGLDLYSLHASIEAVLEYLDRVDPAAAERARARYSCFERFGGDAQAYRYSTLFGTRENCEDAVVSQLLELRRSSGAYARTDGELAADEYFFAEQNALLVLHAEEYYRSMFQGGISSWNLRDRHMADTLESLLTHLDASRRPRSKIVVWAHNSHLGDARATAMGQYGEWNVGQLVREKHGSNAILLGFTTYEGRVTAASGWGADPERKRVRPGLPGSFETLFHQVEVPRFLLPLHRVHAGLEAPRLERAIGVIYLPQTERQSHYFSANLLHQFDAVIHFDKTEAVEPLDRTSTWEQGEAPETFPSGL